jgi:hypothetical protein
MMTGIGVHHRSEPVFTFRPEWVFMMGRITHLKPAPARYSRRRSFLVGTGWVTGTAPDIGEMHHVQTQPQRSLDFS